MVKVAFESTIPLIEWVRERTDFDFVIGNYVLEYPAYAKKYRERPDGRRLILDNGFFEFRKPLSCSDLLRAAEKVRANFVVPPDVLSDSSLSLRLLEDFIRANAGSFATAPVVVGKTVSEQVTYYGVLTRYYPIDMYCFTFKAERAKVLQQVALNSRLPHHLLGFSTREEFAECTKALEGVETSLDTMKPLSATFLGQELEDVGRGKRVRPPLEADLDRELLKRNVETLKGWMSGLDREVYRVREE